MANLGYAAGVTYPIWHGDALGPEIRGRRCMER